MSDKTTVVKLAKVIPIKLALPKPKPVRRTDPHDEWLALEEASKKLARTQTI